MDENINIHLLKASDRIGPCLKILRDVTQKSVKMIGDKIPVSNVDIVIYDNPLSVIKEIGVGGFAVRDHTVLVSLDPRLPNVEKAIKEEVPRTLAHELHHIARRRAIGPRQSLLDVLVLEGLADQFDIEVFGKPPHPWSKSIVSKEKKKLIKLVRKEYKEKCDYRVYREWFLGRGERDIPRWAGYTIGFDLVGKYLKTHKKEKPSLLFKKESSYFVKSLLNL